MPRRTQPLTNTEINAAKPKDKAYNLSDGNNLQLRVKPNGTKLWLLDYYRPNTSKRTTLSLGQYPEVKLAEARKRNRDAKELLANGIDPKVRRDEQKDKARIASENTLLAVTKQWLMVKRSKVSEDHAHDIYRSLELHILPSLGSTPIGNITAPRTIETIRPISAKGNLELVKRLCQRLNEVMTYAINHGLIDNNPLSGIKEMFQQPQKQHMPTIEPAKLPELMDALFKASIKRTTRCLIEWQLHTMTRPGEAAGTRWDEIDVSNRLWTIPASRMKKNKEHTVPLSSKAMRILEEMKPISGHREHVFPGDRNPKAHTNPSTANMALKRMGFHGILVSHGLRALASTTLNENGFAPDIIEAALAHVDKNEVRRAYNRAEYLEQRRELMAWWSSHIEQARAASIQSHMDKDNS